MVSGDGLDRRQGGGKSAAEGIARIIDAHYPCASTARPTMSSDRQTRKRAVNLSVDAELLDEARRLGINVSETLERHLRTQVRAEQEKRWLAENQAAIGAINSFVDRHGLLASRLRYRSERE
jgi:antitoxin CcdA